ncbi:hypothetical protein ACFL6A_01425 [bacterium]
MIQKTHRLVCFAVIIGGLFTGCMRPSDSKVKQNWTHYVRTAGHGVSLARVDDIIRSATDTHVFGIEIDNSLTGYYESFLDPTEKLEAIQALAEKAHEVDNFAYVYTEGLETITTNADQKDHTFFKDHPDWVQRDLSDRPAVFGGGDAFWISSGDEDVWITPFAKEWRKIYMKRMRQIAATGIDGVYIDIPYWMTHFGGWEDTWASFDDYTVAAFKQETGLNAKADLKLGDFTDPNFIKWVDFRIKVLTEFMREVDENVKSVNPECMTIAEIYPGIEESAVRVGSDVYDMYPVVDVIAHEYSGGGGNAARKNPLNWFSYMAGMYTFRAFAEEKASWMLSYSWDGEKEIDPKEAIKNLLMSQIMAGTNCWDARGHVMSGSNDIDTRREVYQWIAKHEKTFYLPRKSIQPIGIYFSPKTRNYFTEEFIASYKGWMYLLLQSHLEFQIVTPRTLMQFSGDLMIFPDVRCLDNEELDWIKQYYASGKSLIVTAESGASDESRKARKENPMHTLLNITEPNQAMKLRTLLYLPQCPGKLYFQSTRKAFNKAAIRGSVRGEKFDKIRRVVNDDIQQILQFSPYIRIEASPFVSTQIADVGGNTHLFFANFKGLKRREKAQQIPEDNVMLSLKTGSDTCVWFLPFLGEIQEIQGDWKEGTLTCVLPDIAKGAVVWFE